LFYEALRHRLRDPSALPSVAVKDERGREDFALLEKMVEMTYLGGNAALESVFSYLGKAASNPATQVTSGWAAEFVATTVQQFTEALRPCVYSGIAALSPGFDWNGSQPKIPTRATTSRINGSFVGEGQPIPVRRATFSAVTLAPKKLSVITEFTNELKNGSPNNIEQMLKMIIENDTRLAVDTVLVDAVAADAIRPAGLRNGVSGLTPSAATDPATAVVDDVQALIAAIAPAQQIALLANPIQAAMLGSSRLVDGVTVRVFASSVVTAGTVIALDLDAFVHAEELPAFDIQEAPIFHEEDTLPLPISAAGAPATVAAPVRSLWQTDCTGIRMVWHVNWGLTRTGAVAWMAAVLW